MPFHLRDFTGEFIGTFMLVFFGCGSVAVTILFSAHNGLLQVAMVWGRFSAAFWQHSFSPE